ncbi:MAG: hypothetical protein HUJ70_06255 [Pseudobutyrivibrio sp.]|nr:hypothetical protein [Pseudobutyrivibrio sp.]
MPIIPCVVGNQLTPHRVHIRLNPHALVCGGDKEDGKGDVEEETGEEYY